MSKATFSDLPPSYDAAVRSASPMPPNANASASASAANANANANAATPGQQSRYPQHQSSQSQANLQPPSASAASGASQRSYPYQQQREGQYTPVVVQGGTPPSASYVQQPSPYPQTQTAQIVYNSGTPYHRGDCPAGGDHLIAEYFDPCGICIGIVFFPIGLICCLLMRDVRCAKCGTQFG